MFVKEPPPFVDTCHWMVGVGEPEKAAVKVTFPPTQVLVVDAGLVVTAGAVLTVSVAAVVVAVRRSW